MTGHMWSLEKSSDAAVASGSPAQHDCHTRSASLDDDLIALCQNFRGKLRVWIEQVGKQAIESYDENAEAGQALHALRAEWGNSLAALRNLAPRTVAGANEKLVAAQVFVAFSCAADGSAIELLARATRELDHVNAGHRTSGPTQTADRANAQAPLRWFERLRRRA